MVPRSIPIGFGGAFGSKISSKPDEGWPETLVPVGFRKHVERALPRARHVELDCGHVPQLERPRETHAAIRDFLRGA